MQDSNEIITKAYELLPQLANQLEMKYALVSERIGESYHVKVKKFWFCDHYIDGFEYDLNGSPCEWVFKNGNLCIEKNVQKCFPLDKDLVKLKIESYIGVAIVNHQEFSIGHLALLDDREIKESNKMLDSMYSFINRIKLHEP